MNGTFTIIKEMATGMGYKLTTERYIDGRWVPGEIKKECNDLCKEIADPFSQPVVYMIYQKAVKQKRCPYKPGVRSISRKMLDFL